MNKDIKRAFSLLKNYYQNRILELTNQLPAIKGIVYEITDACNSKCIHCNIWNVKPTKSVLRVDEIDRLFKDDLFKELEVIILTGGEPVLRKDIIEIISSLHNNLPCTSLAISTNGLLPQRIIEIAEFSLKRNVPLSIGISLDGIGEHHDKIRGIKGNFKKVDFLLHELQNLQNRYKKELNVVIGHTISQHTTESIAELQKYANSFNVHFMTQLYEEFVYYKNAPQETEQTTYTDREKLINVIKTLPLSFHHEMIINALKQNKPNKFKCAALKSFFLLKANGDISPCLRYSNFSAGNLRESSFPEIWSSNKAKEERYRVNHCIGCSNTWAVDWSLESSFLPFLPLMLRTLIQKRLLGKNQSIST